MKPLTEHEIQRLIKNNPGITRDVIEKYQALQAEKFALGPKSQLESKEQLQAADEISQQIKELKSLIFSK